MRCTLAFFLFTLLLSASAGIAADEEKFRTFTSNEGSTIQAMILNANREQVWIERDDGRQFRLSLDRLSEEDQKYVAQWIRRKRSETQSPFDFSTRRYQAEPPETTYSTVRITDTNTGRVRNDDRGIRRVTRNVGYVVKLENRRSDEFDNLRAAYRIYTTGAGRDRFNLSASGETDLPSIAAWREAEFRTDAVETYEVTNHYQSGQAGRQRRDLAGLWIRVYQDDILVAEFSRPTSLARDLEWEETGPRRNGPP